ncbi:MAG: 5,6-dimethylbenzimidazole synthase [candidate division NC10 bacterium]|nr:5,6-dimethylbenzimidazole synthase [Candidatus Rokubacteria bacterium]MBI2563065.1 5,6-dimethylbenzimidazole synthase [candidate division NC10 bacterium]
MTHVPRARASFALSPQERRGVYRAIYGRRDVRAQFLSDPVPDRVLARLLRAAHHAPSVGFMQPWNFIVIRDRAARAAVREAFVRERDRAAQLYEEPRRSQFLELKLEGILEAPLNLCVTCDPERGGPHVLGRSAVRETDIYSTACAVQNLWLAARAEGVGVGWVSIVQPAELRAILGIPEPVLPLAYLCLGYVSEFKDTPDLARAGWRQRLPLGDLVFGDRWGAPDLRVRATLERAER